MPNPDAKQPRAAVDGVVLAAGRSSRMGASKPMLGVGETTFVARVVDSLRDGGCRDVIVVIGADDGPTGAAAQHAGARVVINPAADSEQIDSLRLALRNLNPGAEGIVVLPADHPLVAPSTVSALLGAWSARRSPVARASHQGTAGHPTLFAAAVFDELLHGEHAEGARSVVMSHARELLDVPVDDAGVIADIDTPDDYRRHLGEDA